MKKLGILFLIFGFFSCQKEGEIKFKQLPNTPINHHLIAAGIKNDKIIIKGFKNSTPKDTQINITYNKQKINTKSDPEGRFLSEFAYQKDHKKLDINFVVGQTNYFENYEAKNLANAIKEMVIKDINLEKDITAISIYDGLDKKHIAVLSSTESSLTSYDLDEFWFIKEPNSSITLGNPNNGALLPNKVLTNSIFSIINLYNTNEISLLKNDAKKVIYQDKLKDPQKNPYNPAEKPEDLMAVDDSKFLITFSNYYKVADDKNPNSDVGPGILALIEIKDDKLITNQIMQLPYKNPQFIIKDNQDNNTFWISCSGPWSYDGPKLKAQDGGLVKIVVRNNNFSIDHSIKYENFSPSMPAVLENVIAVPESLGQEVIVVNKNHLLLSEGKKFPNPNPSFFTFAKAFYDDLIFLGQSQNGLIVFSVIDGFLPFPFIYPIDLLKDNNLPIFPQNMILREEYVNDKRPGVDFRGFLALVLAQNKIIPLDFLKVFGP